MCIQAAPSSSPTGTSMGYCLGPAECPLRPLNVYPGSSQQQPNRHEHGILFRASRMSLEALKCLSRQLPAAARQARAWDIVLEGSVAEAAAFKSAPTPQGVTG